MLRLIVMVRVALGAGARVLQAWLLSLDAAKSECVPLLTLDTLYPTGPTCAGCCDAV